MDDIEYFIQLVMDMLTHPKLLDKSAIDENLRNDPQFDKLYTQIFDLRELSAALNNGDLSKSVFSRGFILAQLKALQANLRHLTWQTKQIAEGDFSQKVDFLGEFSDSFNEMTMKLKQTTENMMNLANTDPLTQLSNRLALDQYLLLSFEAAKANGTGLCILIFDLDHFKRVNDTYGHDAGDKVLVQVTKTIGEQFRSSDLFARYGGEEFMAVLPGAQMDTAIKIAQRAIDSVRQLVIDVGSAQLSITVSAGISEIRPDDESYEDIVKRSDDALYQAKGSGRNRLSFI